MINLMIWQLIFGGFVSLLAVSEARANSEVFSTDFSEDRNGSLLDSNPDINPIPVPTNTPIPMPGVINKCESLTQFVNNGISVTEIKPYDERSLLSQLQTYEESLARTQYPELSGLYQNVNRMQGNVFNASSLAVTGNTMPLPAITTTVGNTSSLAQNLEQTGSGTTGSTITTTTNNDGTTTVNQNTSGSTSGNKSGSTQTDGTTYNQVTAQPGVTASIPTAALGTPGFPGSLNYDISPQDTIDKQTALTYQILNLRSLLNQAYTDRLIAQGTDSKAGFETRSQAFLGFTVNIEPKFTDAIAEVEITIMNDKSATTNPESSKHDERLSLISLFPEEKTYNIAKITDDKKSLGAGAVVSVLNIGAAYGKSKGTLYLAKDTDTVAFQRSFPEEEFQKSASGDFLMNPVNAKVDKRTGNKVPGQFKESTSFVWQFRPVLGQKTVNPGVRKVFALVAVPKELMKDGNWIGSFQAVTRWKPLTNAGIVKNKHGWFLSKVEGLKGNGVNQLFTACGGTLFIPSSSKVDSALQPKFTKAKWIDNGNGQITVITDGRNFSKGTQVMSGESVFDQTKNNLSVMGEQRLIFNGSAKNIAKYSPVVINRYGMTMLNSIPKAENPYLQLENEGNPKITPKGTQNSLIEITLKPKSNPKPNTTNFDIFNHDNLTPPIVEIGDLIFGLSDTPFLTKSFDSDKTTFSFIVPNTVLKKNSEIIIRELLNNDSKISIDYDPSKYKIAIPFSVKSVQKMADDEPESKNMTLAIIGSGFSEQTRVVAARITYDCSPSTDGNIVKTESLCVLTIPKSSKKVIISHAENEPLVIDLSQPNPFPVVANITTKDTINKGDSKNINLKMSNISSLKSVFFENIELTYKPSEDKTSIDLFIPQALSGTSGEKEITFVMKDDKRVSYKIIIK